MSYQVIILNFSFICADYSTVIGANDLDTAGVARGCGWQHLVVYVNLATFYCIGVPISGLLGFTLKLQAKVKYIYSSLFTNMPKNQYTCLHRHKISIFPL